MSQSFQVLLLLTNAPTILIPPVIIKGEEYPVQMSTAVGPDGVNFFDLIITDKAPDAIKADLKTQNCKPKTIIVKHRPTFGFQTAYQNIFDSPKYRSIPTTDKEWAKLIKAELVKWLAVKTVVTDKFLFISKHTRRELLGKSSSELWLLLFPFCLIILYYIARIIFTHYGHPFAFLTLFVDYQPDSNQDILSDFKLVALLYSLCNLAFYYAFILKVFENINTEMLQPNKWRRRFHEYCQWLSPFLLFVSSLIIFKELFIFKKGQAIAQEYGFINIATIFDKQLPFLKEEYLIGYFLIIDFILWLMTLNIAKAIRVADPTVPGITSNRRGYLKSAQRNAHRSWVVGLGILLFTSLIFAFMPDPQSKLVVQLFLLQAFYLYVNLAIICAEFKHE